MEFILNNMDFSIWLPMLGGIESFALELQRLYPYSLDVRRGGAIPGRFRTGTNFWWTRFRSAPSLLILFFAKTSFYGVRGRIKE